MGEHTAFLLLLVATLTLSSEVSTTEKYPRVPLSRDWLLWSEGLTDRGHITTVTAE